MPPTLRIDWFRVLADLQEAGFPNDETAHQIDAPVRTLRDWKYGAEPRHADGERLIGFWVLATGKDRESLPRAPYIKLSRINAPGK